MKIQCPSCRVMLSVPDDKIPDGNVRMLCPKCKGPIEINNQPQESVAQEPSEASPETPPSAPSAGAAFDVDDEFLQDESSMLDMVDEGVKTCLVCIGNAGQSQKLKQMMMELDHYVVQAYKPPIALEKLKHNRYDVVVVEEKFGASKLAENLVLHHLQFLPMHVRRQVFVCLLADDLPSFEGMPAFRLGVNLIVNQRDVDKTKIILARAMRDFRSAYHLFNDELGRRGQR